jgi:hypothetical protein
MRERHEPNTIPYPAVWKRPHILWDNPDFGQHHALVKSYAFGRGILFIQGNTGQRAKKQQLQAGINARSQRAVASRWRRRHFLSAVVANFWDAKG